MPRPNLGTMITRAHRLTDIPESSSSRTDAPASQAEMVDEANSGLGDLHDLIIDQWEDYFTVSTQVSMASGSNKVLLPGDFYKLKTIYALTGSDQRTELSRWKMSDRASHRVTEMAEYPKYRVVGKWIEWLPLPGSTRTVEIYYVRQFTPLENTTDEISPEVPRGWEDYIVAHLAEYLLDKRDLDPTPALRRKEMAKRRIVSSSSQRDVTSPRTTTDAYKRYTLRRRYPTPKV